MFDMLGDARDADRVAKRDDSSQQGQALGAIVQGGDQGAIEFDRLKLDLSKVRNGRVTGTEVVKNDGHPKLSQPRKIVVGYVKVPEKSRFRHLDLQAARIETLFIENGKCSIC
jgi:hypothetical protein